MALSEDEAGEYSSSSSKKRWMMKVKWIKSLRGKELYRLLGAIALGQFASLLITFTGLTSTVLALRGIDAPMFQSLCTYLLSTCFYGIIFFIRRKPLQVSWYYYLLLALMDVEGNYFVVKAYEYTSLTRLGLVILSDVHSKDRSGGSNVILGDALVIIGATLYAFTNVSEEFIIKKVDFVELMTFLGLFGFLISGCQVLILERNEVSNISWNRNAILPFLGYATALFFFYSTVPFILRLSGSAMLNLSLLTSDMWAVAIRIFAYHQEVDGLFYVAFTTVAVGLLIYSGSGSSSSALSDTIATEGTAYKRVRTTADENEETREEAKLSSSVLHGPKDFTRIMASTSDV
ncbi:hypothetical protein KP509_1Z025700 [Ceratopteris richardii]|nr:hypothetical protein KP509_1Z025700 [Ceratopteris richardii]